MLDVFSIFGHVWIGADWIGGKFCEVHDKRRHLLLLGP